MKRGPRFWRKKVLAFLIGTSIFISLFFTTALLGFLALQAGLAVSDTTVLSLSAAFAFIGSSIVLAALLFG